MKIILNFLIFQSPTYRSIFDEGQRRLMLVVSVIAPILISYIWFYDYEYGNISSDWPVAIPIFYVIIHLIILVYIWVREGQGKVRPGGNALKTLMNFVISIFLICLIGVSSGYYYNSIYLPQKEKEYENKKIKDFHNYVYGVFHTYLIKKDWENIRFFLHDKVNNDTKEDYLKFLIRETRHTEFVNLKEVKIDSFVNENYKIFGKFTFIAKNDQDTIEKTLTTIMLFDDYENTTKIRGIKIGKIN